MNKIKNKTIIAALIGALNFNVMGCTTPDIVDASPSKQESNCDETIEDTFVIKDELDIPVSTSPEETKEDEENSIIIPVSVVKATTDVNIRNFDNSILGVLPEGKTLTLVEKLENGSYAVNYYDKIGKVDGRYVEESTEYICNVPIQKVLYATKDTQITIPDYLSSTGYVETLQIPALECFEVYETIEDYYLVQTNDYIGYINKEDTEELTGTFVVIDISDQELKLYSNNEVIVTTPVVTGKPPRTPSDQGLFSIYHISYNRDLVGPNYRSYVDIMMKYNGGEGLHDAEYHTNEDGKKHGWRSPQEFGGNTYLTDGSHGCINMLHDDVFEVAEYVEKGTKVLVKE